MKKRRHGPLTVHAAEGEKNKGRILIVEDEESISKLLVGVLQKDGYDVSTCTSGREGLEKVAEHFYNVIMVDLDLRDKDGMVVIETMHEMREDACIVAITSHPSIRSAVEAIRRGAYDYFSEPFSLDMLRMIVDRACERHGLVRAARERDVFRKLSIVDELTGLYNYRYFSECLDREVSRSLRYSYPLALLMIDLDNFKRYNDVNGHIKGNELLRRMGHLFRSSTRESDTIARYGGEEFAVILPHANKEAALELASRFLRIVRREQFENERVLPGGKLTVSIGISSCPGDATVAGKLVELADRSLYRAKNVGRDRVCLWEG